MMFDALRPFFWHIADYTGDEVISGMYGQINRSLVIRGVDLDRI